MCIGVRAIGIIILLTVYIIVVVAIEIAHTGIARAAQEETTASHYDEVKHSTLNPHESSHHFNIDHSSPS